MISSTGRYLRSNFESPGLPLDTINEMNSTGSILASFDITNDRTEDELELSMVRSTRTARMKRNSEQVVVASHIDAAAKRRRSSRGVSFVFF